MNKDELRERLNTLVTQIKSNSKDAHYADKLISDLLSVKGQLGVEPVLLDCGKVIDETRGETYCISITDRGALYHEYGGYSIFVTSSNTALYDTLASFIKYEQETESGDKDEKERIDILRSAVGWVMQVPKIALIDAQFTFDIATKTLNFINKKYEEVLYAEPQKEDSQTNEEFMEDIRLAEEVVHAIKTAKKNKE